LPFEGESLEAVIQMYAPVAYWREQELSVVIPEVGTAGVITPAAEPAQGATASIDSIPVTEV
jgi:hypothetical protein